MTVVIPYASSGPKKANLNEIVFAEGDLSMMTANYSTSMWVKQKESMFEYISKFIEFFEKNLALINRTLAEPLSVSCGLLEQPRLTS